MKIQVIGFNHKTAPVDIREKLAFNSAEVDKALSQLKERFDKTEFILLSTCNRVELYSAGDPANGVDVAAIADFLAEFHDVAVDDFKKYLYVHADEQAVRHLLAVTSSLDSMVVGEGQITGQVKEGYALACTSKSAGKILNGLFHRAFMTSKKVLTNTSVANGRVSVAGVAVELASQLFADIQSSKVVVIGAGKTGELLIQHLLHVGCKDIVVINRSYDRGRGIADKYGIKVKEWDRLGDEIVACDITIASAAVQDYLFEKDSFSELIADRRKGALLVVDISVPRNFDPSINEIEDVYLYSIDELSAVAEQNRNIREDAIVKGMRIVEENVNDFMDWLRNRDIGPLIGQMREKFAQIGQKELKRFFVGVRQEAGCKQAAESMVNRIVNKMVHCVIKNVDVVAKEQGAAEAAKLVDSIVQHADEMTSEPDENKEESQ